MEKCDEKWAERDELGEHGREEWFDKEWENRKKSFEI